MMVMRKVRKKARLDKDEGLYKRFHSQRRVRRRGSG